MLDGVEDGSPAGIEGGEIGVVNGLAVEEAGNQDTVRGRGGSVRGGVGVGGHGGGLSVGVLAGDPASQPLHSISTDGGGLECTRGGLRHPRFGRRMDYGQWFGLNRSCIIIYNSLCGTGSLSRRRL